jgi:hypothetical protein
MIVYEFIDIFILLKYINRSPLYFYHSIIIDSFQLQFRKHYSKNYYTFGNKNII